jgi:hypothetical protein
MRLAYPAREGHWAAASFVARSAEQRVHQVRWRTGFRSGAPRCRARTDPRRGRYRPTASRRSGRAAAARGRSPAGTPARCRRPPRHRGCGATTGGDAVQQPPVRPCSARGSAVTGLRVLTHTPPPTPSAITWKTSASDPTRSPGSGTDRHVVPSKCSTVLPVLRAQVQTSLGPLTTRFAGPAVGTRGGVGSSCQAWPSRRASRNAGPGGRPSVSRWPTSHSRPRRRSTGQLPGCSRRCCPSATTLAARPAAIGCRPSARSAAARTHRRCRARRVPPRLAAPPTAHTSPDRAPTSPPVTARRAPATGPAPRPARTTPAVPAGCSTAGRPGAERQLLVVPVVNQTSAVPVATSALVTTPATIPRLALEPLIDTGWQRIHAPEQSRPATRQRRGQSVTTAPAITHAPAPTTEPGHPSPFNKQVHETSRLMRRWVPADRWRRWSRR